MFYLKKSIFKILTFISLTAICSLNVFAATIVSQSELKTHLRWKVTAKKEIIQIKKKGLSVVFKSLDPEFFETFSKDVAKIKKNKNYHNAFTFTQPEIPGNPYSLRIDLKDDSVELFTFYKQKNNEYVLDFWINKDIVSARKSAVELKPKIVRKVVKRKPRKKKIAKKKVTKKVAKKKVAKKVAKKKVAKKVAKKKVAKKVAKKKVTKKVVKKEIAKKVAPKKVVEKKEPKKVVVEKLETVMPTTNPISDSIEPTINDDDVLADTGSTVTETPSKPKESSEQLTQEYNPDDEQENNAFGYGWSYNEGLESPEDVEKEDEEYDEDAEYASGKPVGCEIDGKD